MVAVWYAKNCSWETANFNWVLDCTPRMDMEHLLYGIENVCRHGRSNAGRKLPVSEMLFLVQCLHTDEQAIRRESFPAPTVQQMDFYSLLEILKQVIHGWTIATARAPRSDSVGWMDA